mgnify:CR=1 FL=1
MVPNRQNETLEDQEKYPYISAWVRKGHVVRKSLQTMKNAPKINKRNKWSTLCECVCVCEQLSY